MALTICTWKWGDKYDWGYVARLQRGVARHLKQPHRFITISSDELASGHEVFPIIDRELLDVPGCFARLRMFDPEWQKIIGVDDRLVCLDLDLVVTGPLDPLFDRPEPYLILQGANAANPCPFNGSVTMLRAGAHPDVWCDFSLDAADQIPFHEFPDDQGWIWHKLPAAAGWKAGPESGIYAFGKPGWPKGEALPKGARIVAFPGSRDPAQFKHLGWVKENWR